MNTTTIDVSTIRAIEHDEAMCIAAAEWDRMIDLLRQLDDAAWQQPTDCDEWTVRDMAGHLLGAAQANASKVVNARQMLAGRKWGKAHDRPLVDGLSAVQIEANRALTPAQVVSELAVAAPRSVKGRASAPKLLRNAVKTTVEIPGIKEKWSLGYLIDLIYTRDVWMHRVDISRATGRELVLSAEHDGRIIEDVVAEWARRHGQPFSIELGGVAGGSFTQGTGGAHIELDAVEFCRIVSGRAPGQGLLAQFVAF